jgi:hypothetical protein
VNILFRDTFDATSFAVHAIDPPAQGLPQGGELVRIRGRGFGANAAVFFGGAPSPEVRVVHSALIEATAPAAELEGVVDVEVRLGAERGTLQDAYRYRSRAQRNLPFDREALRAAGLRTLDIGGLGVNAGVSDLNGDGSPDLVISSPDGAVGAVHIVFGRKAWPDTIREADTTIWEELAVSDFARSFDLQSDLDGDGYKDLLLGGKDREPLFFAPGRTYLLGGYGKTWPQEIGIADAVLEGQAIVFSSGLCDTTNPVVWSLPDGSLRIAIGQVTCVGHDSGVSLYTPQGLEAEPILIGGVQGDPASIGSFGETVAAVGDMNGDGWPDLAVGDQVTQGGAYLILGDSEILESALTLDILDLIADGQAVHFFLGDSLSELGRHIEPAGDFNGDGLPDVIVSAEYGGAQQQGESFVLFGSEQLGTTIHNVDLTADGPTHLRIRGEHSGDRAGLGYGIGDLDGDGLSDVIILGSYNDTRLPKAHVVFGNHTPPPAIDLLTLDDQGFELLASAEFNFLSTRVLGADFDSDGHQDLAIPYRSPADQGILVIFGPIASPSFVRGDANADSKVDISDAVKILGFLFLGEAAPRCFDAADSDDNGKLDLSDAISLLYHLFQGAAPPPPPYPEAGTDPTPDPLDCL